MSELPILKLVFSQQDRLDRAAYQRAWKFDFFRGETWMKVTKHFMGQFQPPGPSFPQGFTSWVIRQDALYIPCASQEKKLILSVHNGDLFHLNVVLRIPKQV